jgi:hypothetical protein
VKLLRVFSSVSSEISITNAFTTSLSIPTEILSTFPSETISEIQLSAKTPLLRIKTAPSKTIVSEVTIHEKDNSSIGETKQSKAWIGILAIAIVLCIAGGVIGF